MRILTLLVLASPLAQAQSAGEVRGAVVDARGGEALSNVAVQLVGGPYRTTSDSTGHFRISGVAAGDYVLNASTVGYHLVKRPFHLDAGETKEFDVVLSSDTLRQTTSVDVQAGPFETARQDSPDALVLAGNDAKNLGSVLADDPLRAVQNLPGVSSNNDFDARFSLRGADYSRIGLFLDGILLHAPFHMLQGQAVQGSATAFNADMVEEMELHEGAWPERYEDRTAGVLDVHTRDGNRDGFSLRASASASNAGVMAEGPLGKKKRGSWIFGVRKSYLQYIFERTFPNTSFIFGFEDAQGRLSYDLTPRNNITLYVLESYSTLDRSNRSTLGVNSLAGAAYHYTLANLGWRYSQGEKLLVSTHAGWMREKYDNTNPTYYQLGDGFYGEWVANSTATWYWNSHAPLDFGASLRQIRESGDSIQYLNVVTRPQVLDHSNGDATHTGGFAQQSWTGLEGHLHLSAGARWDHLSIGDVAPICQDRAPRGEKLVPGLLDAEELGLEEAIRSLAAIPAAAPVSPPPMDDDAPAEREAELRRATTPSAPHVASVVPARVALPTPTVAAIHTSLFSMSELWPPNDRDAVRRVEAFLSAGDARAAVLACQFVVARELEVAASFDRDAAVARDPALVALLLGADGRHYLAFRDAVRTAGTNGDVTQRDAVEAYLFAIELHRRREGI